MTSTATPNFRNDINGLRAVAVLAVVLYHFNVRGFSGGFVGVDMFFVISGFLMTDIIVRGLQGERFSFIAFYMARAKRIMPALVVLCLVLLTLGWRFLLPPDYNMLASHSMYSMAFLSNVEFWREAGYFDVASHQKWLLHTWSLSVEWQFYLLLPPLLWTTWQLRPGLRAQALVVGAISVLSLVAAILVTRSNASTAFYLLPTRAWEMLAGGMIAIAGAGLSLSAASRRLAQLAGLSLIAAAILVFDHQSAWPGWRAIVPVLATMLVLIARLDSAVAASAVVSWVGTRSYSIYLWHWPLCVILVYLERQQQALVIACALGLTLILGELSYRFVETPSRVSLGYLGPRIGTIVMVSVLAAAILPAALIWSHKGIGGRFSTTAEVAANEANNRNPRKAQCHVSQGATSPSCVYGDGAHQVLVVGDSHADAVIGSVASVAALHNAQVVQWTYSGCPIVDGMKKTPAEVARLPANDQCAAFINWVGTQEQGTAPGAPVLMVNRYALAAMGPNESPEEGSTPHVFFSRVSAVANPAYLAEFGKALTATACRAARQRPVYLMRPIPEMGVDVPRTLSRRLAMGMSGDLTLPMAEYWKRNKWVWDAQDAAQAQCGAHILDPLPYLCRDGSCYGSLHGRPLYADDNHLSEYGSHLLAPLFSQMIDASYKQAPGRAATVAATH
jgi:peptidoglycan/LPS O-acetylase OafA/YrhL